LPEYISLLEELFDEELFDEECPDEELPDDEELELLDVPAVNCPLTTLSNSGLVLVKGFAELTP
jgi:hypothetical protein